MEKWVKVTHQNEIPKGQTRAFTIENEPIAISHVEDGFFAYENKCSHMDFPLDDGILEGCEIECAHHGAKFDVKTGEALCMPAVSAIRVYPLKIEGDEIYVEIP